jgi:UDP-N-acetylmuramate dehydrogenase
MKLVIQKNVPLKNKNWFNTGGSAAFYCQPSDVLEFQQAIQFAQHNALEIFVLGQGANILISDDGFDGLVIHPNIQTIFLTDQKDCFPFVTAGAGVSMQALIAYTLENNCIGLEDFSGIPGSVGGSVYINLHYFDKLIEHFLVSAQVIERKTGKIITVDKTWFNFGYDQSKLMERNHYLINAMLQLKKVTDLEIAYAKGRSAEIVRHRISRYPNKNTCGSFFRNFYQNEVTRTINGKKAIWVAYYLDKIGVKGALSIGDAHVSHQHANMLVTGPQATSAEVVDLAKTMQELVFKEFGIIPQPECILVGFKDNPLLKI